MTINIRIAFNFIVLLSVLACGSRSSPPAHFTDTFKYIDTSGHEHLFYGFKNLDSAKHQALIEKKNVLAIFSGYACMSVPNMEWKMLTRYCNDAKIQNQFVIAWLPVDDHKTASDTNKTVWWYGKQRKLATMGEQNQYLEETMFNTSTQPLLVFMNSHGTQIGKTGYTLDEKKVKEFIESGL